MSKLLTNEQRKALLLLTESQWKTVCSDMKKHYKLGGCMPEAYNFLLALTNEQWQTVAHELTEFRKLNKETLNSLRKEVRLDVSKRKKKTYMRDYMRRYREQTGAEKYGQVRNQNSS